MPLQRTGTDMVSVSFPVFRASCDHKLMQTFLANLG
jgi:hypothetical protein